MRRPLHLLALLLLVASCSVVTACGDDEEPTPAPVAPAPPRAPPPPRRSRSGWSPTSAASTTARSTSSPTRASSGPSPSSASKAACSSPRPNSDYVPNLSTLAQQKYDLVIGVGFLMAEAMNTVASKFPDTEVRDHRRRRRPSLKTKPTNVEGLLFKEQEAGYLVGYMAGLYVKDNGGDDRRLGRRPEDPAGRPLHRRLPGGRQGRQPGRQDRQRLLAELRRPGEVQGARAQPDPAGREGRLPGRGRVRPRRARRRQGEGRAGHRRRRRPGLPRRPDHDLGAEEGRRRRSSTSIKGVQDGTFKGGANTIFDVKSGGVGIGKTNAEGAKYADQVKEVQDKIASGELTDIPDTVK